MTRLKVSGMTCEGCANAVRGAIARLAAAAAAAIEAAGFAVARRGA